MKQSDIALIVLVAGVSAIMSFIISGAVITNDSNRSQPVEKVNAITSDFSSVDTTVFNQNAINPTRIITVDSETNNNPFQE